MPAPFQHSFAQALLDPALRPPPGLVAPYAKSADRRFVVHRNNMAAGLTGVLKARFPVTEKIVGEEFFTAMARSFVAAHPPRSPVLAVYGDDFATFIATFEPARAVPYLVDVTRLEAARTRAYHAADAVPLGAAHFAPLTANAGGIRLSLLPSVEIVRSSHPIVTIWSMNAGERELAPIAPWRGEDALVARPNLDVELRMLPSGGAAFLQALAADGTIHEAAEAALADDPGFDLTANLAGLIGSGLVCAIRSAPQPDSSP